MTTQTCDIQSVLCGGWASPLHAEWGRLQLALPVVSTEMVVVPAELPRQQLLLILLAGFFHFFLGLYGIHFLFWTLEGQQ